MDYNIIKEILDKYWSGESTLAEEKQLKQFYAAHPQLPAELEQYRSHFDFLVDFKTKNTLDATFDQKWNQRVHQNEQTPSMPQNSIVRRLQPILSIAAIFVLFLGIAWFVQNIEEREAEAPAFVINNQEIKDPQKAYEITKSSLALISKKIKAGNKHIKHLKKFNQTSKMILKSKNNPL